MEFDLKKEADIVANYCKKYSRIAAKETIYNMIEDCAIKYAEAKVKEFSSKQDVSGRSELLLDFFDHLQSDKDFRNKSKEVIVNEYLIKQ